MDSIFTADGLAELERIAWDPVSPEEMAENARIQAWHDARRCRQVEIFSKASGLADLDARLLADGGFVESELPLLRAHWYGERFRAREAA